MNLPGAAVRRSCPSRVARITLLLAAIALTVLVGCPPPTKVIDNLPSPAAVPVRPTPEQPVAPTPPPPPTTKTIAGKRIMVDPGHGGKDPGAGKGTKSQLPEKAIVLDIGNRLTQTLRARGATVIPTRTTDVFIELEDRASAADRNRVDLFVSVHANSAGRSSAAGAEVHIFTKASTQSWAAARAVAAALQRAGIPYRGIIPSNFHVLREHSRPAMLIETGYLTNTNDARNLNSPAFRAKIANAIADGVTDYLCH